MPALAPFDLHLAQNVSPARHRDSLRLLRHFESSLGGRSLNDATAEDFAAFLHGRLKAGYSPGTLRKERQLLLSYFSWAYEAGTVGAAALLTFRAVKSPASATSRSRPDPYPRKDLRRLRAALDERWPKLPAKEAGKRVARWREGVAPYPRIRKHAIRLQLEAVVALCLHAGLRRAEVFALHIDDMHYDNAHVVVWRGERFGSDAREVPFTQACRESVREWIEFRAAMKPGHDRPWLNLWAADTAREPVARETFDKLLANYLGQEWSYRRMRHTAGVNWLRAGLTIWELQRLLGHRTIKDALPYGEAIETPLERRMERLERDLTARVPLAA